MTSMQNKTLADKFGSDADWLRAIVNGWAGPIYIVTADYRIRFMNRRLIDRLGRDATGDYCYRVLYGRSEPCPWCAQEVFQGETARNRLQQPADGRWYEILHIPLPFADGTFGKITFIREDPEPPPLTQELPVFQLLVDRLSDAVIFQDPETGRVLYVNDEACSTLGYRREELLRLHIWDYSEAVASREEWRDNVAHLEEAGGLTLETRHRRRDGGFVEVEVKATAVQVALQRYIVSVARDISDRKEAAARLLAERNKLEAVMAAIGDGISVQDTDFRIVYQNEVQIAREGEHLGSFCYRAYQQRDRICDDCPVAESFTDGRLHRRQVVAETPQGVFDLELTACPLRDSSGEVIACVEVVRDITEQKRMAQALQESNEKYRLLFAAESEAILTYDAQNGTIQEVNNTACHVYGIERAAFIGRRWSELLAEGGEELGSNRHLALHRRGDGTVFPVEFSCGTFLWQGRSVIVAVVHDISERLRQERSREEIFSVLSHEMRTPLTAILGFSEYLLENEKDDPHREILQLIVKEGSGCRISSTICSA